MEKRTSSELMKRSNTRTILQLIHEEQGIYRKEIAQKSHMSPQTVTNLVKELSEKGIITETMMYLEKKGRNPVALALNYRKSFIITAELSSKRLSIWLHNLMGEVVKEQRWNNTSEINPLEILKISVGDLVEEYKDQLNLSAIVLSVEGVVEEALGIVVTSEILNWHKLDLKKELAAYEIPILVRNDVNLLAHNKRLLRDKEQNLMVVKVDKGIGASFVLNRKVLKSTNNVIGELGHVTVHVAGEKRKCSCGKYNCLTGYISRNMLIKEYGGSYEKLAMDLQRGKKEAVKLMDNISELLAESLSNLIILLDLDRIILTGSTMEDFGEYIYPRLSKKIWNQLSFWISFKGLEFYPPTELTKVSSEFVLSHYFATTEEEFLWDI